MRVHLTPLLIMFVPSICSVALLYRGSEGSRKKA